MTRKLMYSFFTGLIGAINIALIADLYLSQFKYYILSLFLLGLGIASYPFDFKLRFKTDYMFLLILLFVILNLLNIIFFHDFSFFIFCINVFVGVLGVILTVIHYKFNLNL